MRQREIWYVDLNPVKGSGQAGLRPVLVISGNLLNSHLNVVISCPLTTKIKGYKGNPILEPDAFNGLSCQSEVLVFHVRSISKDRFIRKIGSVALEDIAAVKKTLNEILTY